MVADLHTHTIASDGTTTPEENVRLAVEAGLEALAVTDHDTIAAWAGAEAACARAGIEFVPGLELSTEQGGYSLHLLGYWVDPEDADLAAECARLRHERERRARAVLRRLQDLGVEIGLEPVQAIAAGAPIGRPHIAAAMVEAGVVPDTDAAFDQYLHDGGPAYEPKRAVGPPDGVRLIRAAGGVAVLAHPGCSLGDEVVGYGVPVPLLDELVAVGLTGVEVDHPSHDEDVRRRWRGLAEERELIVTGSSDFHGRQEDRRIGACTSDRVALEALRERSLRSSGREQRGGRPPW